MAAVVLTTVFVACNKDDDNGITLTEVIIEPDNLTLLPGDVETLIFYTEPFGSSEKKMTWASSNKEVATVDNTGKVTAIAPGTTVITATAKNGVTGACNVVVISNLPKQMRFSIQNTSSATRVDLYIYGTGTMTIDWGDGTAPETHTLFKHGVNVENLDDLVKFSHNYTGVSSRIIKVTAVNISHFYFGSSNYTKLFDLDVSGNPALIELRCSYNQLTHLDVSANIALTLLNCAYNQLTELNVSANSALEVLECYNNQITRLDVSGNPALSTLFCSNNQLTALDLSKNKEIYSIDCRNNLLANLKIGENTALNALHCANNRLTSLDVSKNNELIYVDSGNNLLNAGALNSLFGTLNSTSTPYPKSIYIYENQGVDGCDKSIAQNKGWVVKTDKP